MENLPSDLVEICINEDGFLGSYFLARVVDILGGDRLGVEYITLFDSKDEKKRLKEKVEAYKVRPLPPEIRVSGFDVMDKVDVYDLDGWWVGRVIERYGSNYRVYFDSTGDEIVYPFDKLRVHQEYDNGQWIPSQKKGNQMLPL